MTLGTHRERPAGPPAHLHGIVTHLTSVGAELISIGPITPTQHTATNETSYP